MDSEYLSTSDCHGSGHNSVLHACFESIFSGGYVLKKPNVASESSMGAV